MYILGISAFYHDSAAALIKGGEIVAAAQEERFSRKRHDARFPLRAIVSCLHEAGISFGDIACVVFYDKPLVKFERILETSLAFAPRGFRSFLASMPVWLKEKLFLKQFLKKKITELAGRTKHLPPLFFAEHHQSHAASAFYPSPFERAAVLCLDGVGEWSTTSAWEGSGKGLCPLWQINFPHSLGLLYSAFTAHAGFKVNSGEYKLMGLSPYGEPAYVDAILKHLLDLKEDGTFRLNMEYFNFATGLTMTNKKFSALFGGAPRVPEGPITMREMNLARSIQVVTEEVVLRLARMLHREHGGDNLCLAGGVALNCVANGRLLREGPFRKIWIQPAAGDAGGALGAALLAWHHYYSKERIVVPSRDAMKGGFLGPHFSEAALRQFLDALGIPFLRMDDVDLMPQLSKLLEEGRVIGWFQGRMEFGPRALGARSILADPRHPKMQSILNTKIKFRESFRPFAPSVLRERAADYFELEEQSPYMLFVAPVKSGRCFQMTGDQQRLFGIEKLNVPRSEIPAVTHVDYSARIQTVDRETNPRYYDLLRSFEQRTGCPLLVNTSFNVRGEPIVCTPEEAYRCFMRTEMDFLVLENFLLSKSDQPRLSDGASSRKEYELD